MLGLYSVISSIPAFSVQRELKSVLKYNSHYYDYQSSKARRSFGHKITVNISSPSTFRALLSLTSMADKLPLEMEPVARDNKTS